MNQSYGCDSHNFKHSALIYTAMRFRFAVVRGEGGGNKFILQWRKKTVEVSVLRQLIKKCSLPQCCVERRPFYCTGAAQVVAECTTLHFVCMPLLHCLTAT